MPAVAVQRPYFWEILGAVSEFDKAMVVAKLKGARDRKRAARSVAGRALPPARAAAWTASARDRIRPRLPMLATNEGAGADDNDAPIFPGAISKPSARGLCYRRGGDDAA
jgi:hypothetical protein